MGWTSRYLQSGEVVDYNYRKELAKNLFTYYNEHKTTVKPLKIKVYGSDIHVLAQATLHDGTVEVFPVTIITKKEKHEFYYKEVSPVGMASYDYPISWIDQITPDEDSFSLNEKSLSDWKNTLIEKKNQKEELKSMKKGSIIKIDGEQYRLILGRKKGSKKISPLWVDKNYCYIPTKDILNWGYEVISKA